MKGLEIVIIPNQNSVPSGRASLVRRLPRTAYCSRLVWPVHQIVGIAGETKQNGSIDRVWAAYQPSNNLDLMRSTPCLETTTTNYFFLKKKFK